MVGSGRLASRQVLELRVTYYRIRLLQTDEGWSVSCLDLPGCHSQAESREEALPRFREAVAPIADLLRQPIGNDCGGWQSACK